MKIEFFFLLTNCNKQLSTLHKIALGIGVSDMVFWIHRKKEKSRSDEKRVEWEHPNFIHAVILIVVGSHEDEHYPNSVACVPIMSESVENTPKEVTHEGEGDSQKQEVGFCSGYDRNAYRLINSRRLFRSCRQR